MKWKDVLSNVLLLMFFVSTNAFAQPISGIKVEKVEDVSLIEVFEHITNVNRYENNLFSVKVFSYANPPGSAHQPGTGEISYDYFLLISEFDEYPTTSLFRTGSFYAPKIHEVKVEKDQINLLLRYGGSDRP